MPFFANSMFVGSVRTLLLICLFNFTGSCSGLGGPNDKERDHFLTDLLTTLSADWDFSKIEDHSTPEAYDVFVGPANTQATRIFATLGKFRSLDASTTTGWRSMAGSGTVVNVESEVSFENGSAHVSTTLTYDGDRLLLHYIYIRSPLFIELMERGAQSSEF